MLLYYINSDISEYMNFKVKLKTFITNIIDSYIYVYKIHLFTYSMGFIDRIYGVRSTMLFGIHDVKGGNVTFSMVN